MDTVVSGIRATGNLHIGNYFGAIKNFVEMQYNNKCFFFIADYHSLTTHPTPQNIKANIRQILAEYIACGVNPDISTIYIQSKVPQTAELYLLLNMNAYLGELQRCTSFKEKARKQPDNINAGLLTYPVLMAADILIHKATKVPVGKDQEQHLEMARTFANRFNRMYNVKYFPEPFAYNFGKELIKIPGLDGTGKMGKSEGTDNAIYLADTPQQIRKKVMKAVTDSGPTSPNQQMSEPVKNLFTIMSIVSSHDTYSFFIEKYNNMTIRYGDMKKQLAEDIINKLKPIQEKASNIINDNNLISKIIKQGTEKAAESANKTIKEVKEIIGLI